MKKVLVAGAALMLAGGIAIPAFASHPPPVVEPGVKITGNARARIVYRDAYDFGLVSDKSADFYMDSRLRFDVVGTAAGGAFVHARIRAIDGRFNGGTENNSKLSSDDRNLYADKAYLSIPMGQAFTFEIGKNRISYGNGFIYDDIGTAGVRGIYQADNLRFISFFDMMEEGTVSPNPQDRLKDNDVYRFGGVVDINVNPDVLVGAMAGYQVDDRAAMTVTNPVTGAVTVTPPPDREGFFGSVWVRGKSGAFGLEGELVYNEKNVVRFNEENPGITLSTQDGYGGYVRPSFTMDAMTLSVDLGFTQDGYIVDPFYGFVMIGGEWATQVMPFGQDGDWLWGALSAKYQVSEAMFLVGNFVYADVDSNTPVGLSDLWEVSGMLQYNISRGANLQYRIGYLTPSYDNRADDSAFGTFAQFNISF